MPNSCSGGDKSLYSMKKGLPISAKFQPLKLKTVLWMLMIIMILLATVIRRFKACPVLDISSAGVAGSKEDWRSSANYIDYQE
jgi:hypothetical protein